MLNLAGNIYCMGSDCFYQSMPRIVMTWNFQYDAIYRLSFFFFLGNLCILYSGKVRDNFDWWTYFVFPVLFLNSNENLLQCNIFF